MWLPDYPITPDRETVFSVDPRPIKFGPQAILELGSDAKTLGITNAAVFTEPQLARLEAVQRGIKTIEAAGVAVEVYDRVTVEPTDASFLAAADFLKQGGFDGLISIGGGSVIDTGKAANLFASHPAAFTAYVNPPVGEGRPVPGPLMPHIACPTTAGTGSEATAVAVFDFTEKRIKTGIASKFMKPSLGIIDPELTHSMPPLVTAATAFDVLTHAIESYTAIPYTKRPKLEDPSQRPAYQGANPYSDVGALQAIRLGGQFLLTAVNHGQDEKARTAMAYASTLAGASFGNAGVHIPHAMSYSVAGMIRDYQPAGWPSHKAMCPHGISVVVNAPAAFRFTAKAHPERHRTVAEALGANVNGVPASEGGEVLATRLIELMRAAGIPMGLSELGYGPDDIPQLVAGAEKQARLLRQSPCEVTAHDLEQLYRDAMQYS